MNRSHSRTATIIKQETQIVDEIRSGRANWREFTGASRPMFLEETWDRSGIAMLIGAGIRAFEEKAGFRLPWNLAREGSWQGFAWGKTTHAPWGWRTRPLPPTTH